MFTPHSKTKMAQAQNEFISIKEAVVSDWPTKGLTEFNIASILDYFIKVALAFQRSSMAPLRKCSRNE